MKLLRNPLPVTDRMKCVKCGEMRVYVT